MVIVVSVMTAVSDFDGNISVMHDVFRHLADSLGLLHSLVHCSVHSHVSKPSHRDVGRDIDGAED